MHPSLQSDQFFLFPLHSLLCGSGNTKKKIKKQKRIVSFLGIQKKKSPWLCPPFSQGYSVTPNTKVRFKRTRVLCIQTYKASHGSPASRFARGTYPSSSLRRHVLPETAETTRSPAS